MGKLMILSAGDIQALFTIDMAVKAVEDAYRQKNSGEGSVWPMVFHEFERGVADLDIKSGDLETQQVFGLKLVSWYGKNEEKGLPELFGTSMLFDRRTGEPIALLNAGPVTGMRTGAAGAVGAKLLANTNAKRLVMVGCGAQSPYLIAAALYAMPNIETVQVVNPHHPEKAAVRLPALAERAAKLLKDCGAERRYTIEASEDTEACVRSADIILTATPSYEPVIRGEWVKPGAHISCIGADMSGKQELDADILVNASVYGDDAAQCLSVGECECAFKAGKITGLKAEIGDVLIGKATGRTSENEITVFDSTGIALQDLASAALIVEKAKLLNMGTVVKL